MTLRLPSGTHRLEAGAFELAVPLPLAQAAGEPPPQLRAYTVIDLDAGADAGRIGIRGAELQAGA